MTTIGSILHGAYGDYYEQMLCLKRYKHRHPADRLVLFFESPARFRELQVLDTSWADETHLAEAIPEVHVDRFLQYQALDEELQQGVLASYRDALRGKLDPTENRKPWTTMRTMDLKDPSVDVGLSEVGQERFPQCIRENGIDERLLSDELTVGFVWRYRARAPGAAISNFLQPSEEVVLRTKSELLAELIRGYGAHVLVCGMNLTVTEENRSRVDAKFTNQRLDVASQQVHYMKGLSWGLELEILRRCSLCIVMPSGFSEALWIKRRQGVCLVDAPPHYLLKLAANRMPLFDVLRPRELMFQVRQPHSKQRVLDHLRARGDLPSLPG